MRRCFFFTFEAFLLLILLGFLVMGLDAARSDTSGRENFFLYDLAQDIMTVENAAGTIALTAEYLHNQSNHTAREGIRQSFSESLELSGANVGGLLWTRDNTLSVCLDAHREYECNTEGKTVVTVCRTLTYYPTGSEDPEVTDLCLSLFPLD